MGTPEAVPLGKRLLRSGPRTSGNPNPGPIIPGYRQPRLANQLFRTFLQGFDREVEKRDHRAKVLLSENINPGLQKASMRRYFARLGFQMLGGNQLGGEIWARKLKTQFSF